MKASFKNTLRTIWRTRARYLSIMCIVALGVGFFAGIKAGRPDMINSTDRYTSSQNLMHFRILSTWGFDEEDVAALRNIEGVSVKESYFYDGITESTEGEGESRLIAYVSGSQINKLLLKDGRLPVKDDECLVDSASSLVTNGSRMTVKSSDAGDFLDNKEYTVVGHVYSSMFISDFERGNTTIGDGELNHIFFVPEANFRSDYHTEIYLVFEDMKDATVYSSRYGELEEEARKKIDEVALGRIRERYEKTVSDARAQIADAEKQIADGEAELADAKAQLDDAKKQIEDGKAQLQDAEELLREKREELAEGKRLLAEGEAEYEQKTLEAGNAAVALIEARRKYTEGYEQYVQAERDAEKELSDAREKINAAEAELAQGKAELDNAIETYEYAAGLYDRAFAAYEKISAGYEELKESGAIDPELAGLIAQYNIAAKAFESVRKILDETKATLDEKQAEYDRYCEQLEEAKEQYADGEKKAASELANAKKQLDDAKAEIEYNEELMIGGADLLAEAKKTLDESRSQIEEGEALLAEAEAEIASKKAELEDGIEKYGSGKKEYDSGVIKLSEAKAELESSKEFVDGLVEPEWIVFTRDDNGGYTEFGQNAERIGNIAKVFPAFFIIVAALVSITGMTRLVSEERTQIGTMKALGYSDLKVFGKYMFYCLSATFLGCVIGLAIGYKLFPFVILKAYSILYHVQVMYMPFLFTDALIITGISLAIASLTVLFSCFGVMRQMPAKLMRPASPPSGKRVLLERIHFLWKRFSFFRKVTIRNVFRYKKRMTMTLIGIMGCTALMLCGFALWNSINDVVDKQFDKVMHFQALIYTKGIDDSSRESIDSLLKKYDPESESIGAMQKSYMMSGVNSHSGNLLVAESSEKAERILSPKSRTTGEYYSVEPGGALITEKLAKLLGVKIGDSFEISLTDTKKGSVKVCGIIENYIYHYVIIGPDTYVSIAGEEPNINIFFLKYSVSESKEGNLAAELVGNDNVLTVLMQSYVRRTFSKMMEALHAVVLVLIMSAVALAVIVVYNLASINIAERTREISTLEVLGLTDREVSMYIFRESIVLSVIGSLLGLLLGQLLTNFVIETAEIDLVMFGRDIHFVSYLLACALTIFFSLAVNLFMNRSLKKISMAESLKSVD